MSSIYFVLFIFPMIFFVILIFIFQSGLTAIANQQFLMNCPLPINSGVALISTIDNNQVIYTVTYDNATSDYHLTLFSCQIVAGNQNANTIVFTEASTNWFGVANGYLAYFANVLSQTGLKIQAFFTMVALFVDAPAQVTGLAFFTYIQVLLLAWIAIGGFFAFRGIG